MDTKNADFHGTPASSPHPVTVVSNLVGKPASAFLSSPVSINCLSPSMSNRMNGADIKEGDIQLSKSATSGKSFRVSETEKLVYFFGAGEADGNAKMASLLGGKGANLAEMTTLGLPVPPGFTIPTTLCSIYQNSGFPTGLYESVAQAITRLENSLLKRFGSEDSPLLLSVRSGAPISMPGMLDTVLNLGLNDKAVRGLAKQTGNHRFAWDSYRRFIQMFGNVVLGINSVEFENILEIHKKKFSASTDSALSAEQLESVVQDYKSLIKKITGKCFEQDVYAQLWMSIAAVFTSWNNERARVFRKLNGIADSVGTAVTVQAMVFGNSGATSATGVAFTRDPSNGGHVLYGEFLINAQGEDVVAGIRTPQPISNIAKNNATSMSQVSMEDAIPEMYEELKNIAGKLESHFRDVQDIEFTIENGKMYILQTRNGKRSGRAAVKIAVDLALEGTISKADALKRIKPTTVKNLLHPTLDKSTFVSPLVCGMPASPGAASGRIAFSCAVAEKISELGIPVILVRDETSPDDIVGLSVSKGVLTARGGMTSHAAVVARGMGTPCVTGVNSLIINESAGTAVLGKTVLQENDMITIDGDSGNVYSGNLPLIPADLSSELVQLLTWADEVRKMDILANADTPADLQKAIKMGAQGVGLCRTEHMFFSADRISPMREMILANDEKSRKYALSKLAPMQEDDFYGMLKILNGKLITVRLLDPPLHEFLPQRTEEIKATAESVGVSTKEIVERSEALKEANPMLGMRGCRVGLQHSEIYEMQVCSLLRAAIRVAKEDLKPVMVDIMIPFVVNEKEVMEMRNLIDKVAKDELSTSSLQENIVYRVGTMIELPRAALQAGKIAKHAEFFSFGSNDLTQTTYGLSRDDSTAVVNLYQKRNIFEEDPFVSLDTEGVGELIKIAVDRGIKARKDLKLCLCGEQGAEEKTIEFCNDAGLHSVSCSPFRVPVARLAAARAVLYSEDREIHES